MFLIVLLGLVVIGYSASSGGIDLAEIRVLHLSSDGITASNKGEPIPQLNCVDGEDLGYLPTTVTCRNLGWTGTDFAWDCTAEMPEHLEFSEVTVSCEGWSGPGDRVVVPGSCGLFYGLRRKPGVFPKKSVHMGDLSTLLLYSSKRTSSGLPQMKCVGMCSGQLPEKAVCKNLGWDANSGQYLWDCTASMGSNLDFRDFEVVCEGVTGVGDLNIIEGSCRLEYSLDSTHDGVVSETPASSYVPPTRRPSKYARPPSGEPAQLFGSGVVIVLAIVALVAMCYYCCVRKNQSQPRAPRGVPRSRVAHSGPAPYPTAPDYNPEVSTGVRHRSTLYPDPTIHSAAAPAPHVVHHVHHPTATRSGGYTTGLVHGMMAGSAMNSGSRHHHHHSSVPLSHQAPRMASTHRSVPQATVRRQAPSRAPSRTVTRSSVGGSRTVSSSRSTSSSTTSSSKTGGTRTR